MEIASISDRSSGLPRLVRDVSVGAHHVDRAPVGRTGHVEDPQVQSGRHDLGLLGDPLPFIDARIRTPRDLQHEPPRALVEPPRRLQRRFSSAL
jgi:hypothetical protein